MNGWIKLHRKLVEWEWYQDHTTFRVFLHLLLTANHEHRQWQGNTVLAGQKITSYQHLAQETGLSVRSIRTALTKLKTTGEVTYTGTSKYSLITIQNWDSYQTTDPPLDKRPTRDRHATDKQTTTNKNDKNDKNDKNNYGEFKNVQLSEVEHRKLIDRFGSSAIATLIFDLSTYLKSSGKTYRDHYATILNWAKRKGVAEIQRQVPKITEAPRPLTTEEIERNKSIRTGIGTMLRSKTFKSNN